MSADGRLSRGTKRTFIVLLVVILVLAALPVLSVVASSILASTYGCTVHEGFSNPCMIAGEDRGDMLYSMFVMGWLGLISLPFGMAALIAWTVALMIAVIRARKKANLA
ncbi:MULTISPECIES: hypothetical protein [unclassified Nitratireductor]|uniref:hypothetical protein n=1 Tax=unclassified Nitratireductor TaxID=2641084 RepID=UPI0024BE4604|nr:MULTISPECIES: hypothetical protein [unclassified Nitratireductor]MCV0351185.1 hypothetical protein [Nitratireductor sp.]MDJ1464456.1 hypothetical protein [Nitratireductor sp. GZWM139]